MEIKTSTREFDEKYFNDSSNGFAKQFTDTRNKKLLENRFFKYPYRVWSTKFNEAHFGFKYLEAIEFLECIEITRENFGSYRAF